jgi:hypothetical protein
MPPTAHAEAGAVVRITEFSHTGKVSRLGSGDGEYVELTNTGDAPADLTGWTYDNKTADPANGLSLTPLGTVAPGVSVIVTDLSATEFRDEWALKDSVQVLSSGLTHTLSSGPDAIHVYDDGGAEIDSVSYDLDFTLGRGQAAVVDAAHLGANAGTTGWSTAYVDDPDGSWASGLGSVGSPGASTHGALTPNAVRDATRPGAPCDTVNVSPEGQPPTNPSPRTWPGTSIPQTIDAECAWATAESGRGLSGLVFDPNDANVLYALKDTGRLYRLVRAGGAWTRDTANGWAGGKALRFPSGDGIPDTEGVTVGVDGKVYVTTERDYSEPGVPLASVLRFDPTSAATTLVATDQWVLTPDLLFTDGDDEDDLDDDGVYVDADGGLTGVTYLPDSFLTENFFRTDADSDSLYDPDDFPRKAVDGLFVVAVEKTGHLLVYALNTDHTYTRVANVADGPTGLVGVMDVSFDAELSRVWAHCDNRCMNATSLLKVGADGHLGYDRYIYRPAALPDFGFEGFAVAPAATAVDGVREVLWADDDNRFGHSLWSSTLDADLQLAQAVTPLPMISGLPVVGQGVLTAQLGTWGGGVEVHYRWLVDSGVLGEGGTVIGTDAPLSLADPTLAGRTVVLAVTGTRNGFLAQTMTASVAITSGVLTTTRPRISGVAAVGRTLRARAVGWGPPGVTLRYQWFASGRQVPGATGTTLRLRAALLGRTISVRVTGARSGFEEGAEESSRSARVRAGTIATARPKIGGRAGVGHRLVARPGGAWRADGTAVRYRYRWYVSGKAVRGATKAGFHLTRAARGKRIRVKVTGYAVGYATTSRFSAATARVR